MIRGNVLFGGDSIMVSIVGRIPRYVKAEGISVVALGGQTSDWLLRQMKGLEAYPGELEKSGSFVMLIGTNDLAGTSTPEKIFDNIVKIWDVAKKHGLKVYAMTVPPFRGWATYAPSWDTKRHALNQLISTSPIPTGIVPLHTLLADPADPDHLSKEYDSADHLHPNPIKLGALVESEVSRLQSLSPSLPSPSPTPSPVSSPPVLPPTNWLLVGGVVGALALGGWYLFSRPKAGIRV